MHYDFLVETYETERIKVVSTWSEFRDEEMLLRPKTGDPRGRSVHEQMVHQCVSEDLWMRTMLGIDVNAPPLPKPETRLEFIRRYAEDSGKRLDVLRAKDECAFDHAGNHADAGCGLNNIARNRTVLCLHDLVEHRLGGVNAILKICLRRSCIGHS